MSTQHTPAAARDACQAGADSAAVVITAQLRAGMPADRIEQSAWRVLADRLADPTPASTAFYDAYAQVASTYVAAAREFGLDRDLEAEAG